jgi:sugar/nucleoside kinase (ribokinase family)
MVDLADEARPLLARVREAGVPLVCDLHDYDGKNPFHQDFVDAGDVLFLNDDAMPDPVPWMRDRAAAGASLVVVTQGAGGATAVTPDEVRHVPAPVVAAIVDTNGAGDAFVAGFLMARLGGAALPESMAAGHRQAARCLAVPDLAPPPTDG